MKLITIAGKAQNGKDTSAEILKGLLEVNGKRVLITHYGDVLKFICRNFMNWDGVKDEHGRSLLQYVGASVIRKTKPDYLVDFIIDMANFFKSEYDYMIIADCRVPNEIERLRQAGFDVLTLKVIRPDFDNGLTEEQKKHMTEVALDNYEMDYTIMNSGDISNLQLELLKVISKEEL